MKARVKTWMPILNQMINMTTVKQKMSDHRIVRVVLVAARTIAARKSKVTTAIFMRIKSLENSAKDKARI